MSDDTFQPDLVTTDEALDLVIDGVMLGSKPLRNLTKKVLRAQRRLHGAVDDEGYAATHPAAKLGRSPAAAVAREDRAVGAEAAAELLADLAAEADEEGREDAASTTEHARSTLP